MSHTLESVLLELETLLDSFFVTGAKSFLVHNIKNIKELLTTTRSMGMLTLSHFLEEICLLGEHKTVTYDELSEKIAGLDAYLAIAQNHSNIEKIKTEMESGYQ